MEEVVNIWRIWCPSGANDESRIVGMLRNMLPYGASKYIILVFYYDLIT